MNIPKNIQKGINRVSVIAGGVALLIGFVRAPSTITRQI